MEDVIYDDGGHTHNKHTPHGVKSGYLQSPIFISCIVCSVEYSVYDKAAKSSINNSFFDWVRLLDADGGTEEDVSDDSGDVIEFFSNYRGIVHDSEPNKIKYDKNGYGDETT